MIIMQKCKKMFSGMENTLFRKEATYIIDKISSTYDLNLLLSYSLI